MALTVYAKQAPYSVSMRIFLRQFAFLRVGKKDDISEDSSSVNKGEDAEGLVLRKIIVHLRQAQISFIQAHLIGEFTDAQQKIRALNGQLNLQAEGLEFIVQNSPSFKDQITAAKEKFLHSHSITKQGSYHYLAESPKGKDGVSALESKCNCVITINKLSSVDAETMTVGGTGVKTSDETGSDTAAVSVDGIAREDIVSSEINLVQNLLRVFNRVKKVVTREKSPNVVEFDLNHVRLVICHGDITKYKADVLVNFVDKDLKCTSELSKTIQKAAGKGLELGLSKKRPCAIGDVVPTMSFNMSNCNHIYHAVLPPLDNQDRVSQVLRQALIDVLLLASSEKRESVLVPVLDHQEFNKAFLHSFSEYLLKEIGKLKVVTVCHPKKESFYKFKDYIQKSLKEIEPVFKPPSQDVDMEPQTEASPSDVNSEEVGLQSDDVESFLLGGESYNFPHQEGAMCEITARTRDDVQKVKRGLDRIVEDLVDETVTEVKKLSDEAVGKELFVLCLKHHVINMIDKKASLIRLKGNKEDVETVKKFLLSPRGDH